jgi:sugar phosphate isomerase/epimerase
MKMRRRDFMAGAALGAAATATTGAAAATRAANEGAKRPPVRVGMTDWNLGQRGDISKISLAREIGLDGIQISLIYDPRNIKVKVGDPYGDATLLGNRIHQIHVKNGKKLMREVDALDWPRLAQEFYDVGYKGWYVLETSSPSGDLIKDTRDNIDYVRKTFRIPS